MKQLGLGLNLSTKKTRKRDFLEQMQRVVPWAVLVQIVEPHYPKAKTGRPPVGSRPCCASTTFMYGPDAFRKPCDSELVCVHVYGSLVGQALACPQPR